MKNQIVLLMRLFFIIPISSFILSANPLNPTRIRSGTCRGGDIHTQGGTGLIALSLRRFNPLNRGGAILTKADESVVLANACFNPLNRGGAILTEC